VEQTGPTRPDGAVVVRYREAADTRFSGPVYDLADYARLFSPELSVADLADIARADDLSDPSGPGARLPVDRARTGARTRRGGLAPEPGGAQRPVKTAARLARNASTASRWSAVAPRPVCRLASSARVSSSESVAAVASTVLIAR
jgi:hypothetical protein